MHLKNSLFLRMIFSRLKGRSKPPENEAGSGQTGGEVEEAAGEIEEEGEKGNAVCQPKTQMVSEEAPFKKKPAKSKRGSW
jgi:hypothetical protein